MNAIYKKISFIGVALVGIILTFFIYTQDSTISNLSLISAKADAEGNYEAPTSITFIEKLGLLYLSSGLSYSFGHSNEVVEIGFQTLLSANLDDMTDSAEEKEDIFIIDDIDKISEVVENVNDNISEENSSESSEVVEEEFNWKELYEVKFFNTLDSNGKEFGEKDITVRYTTPIGLTKDNIPTASNIWQLNYRYKDGGLIGVDTSYWTSVLFKDSQVFDRAWTSLKWIVQDYLHGAIVKDSDEVFEAIIYSNDSKYYWYLYLDKLTNLDIFEDGNKLNTIAMTVEPISIDNAYKIMYSLGYVSQAETNTEKGGN